MAMSSNKGGGVFADINITPLTDIFLVLLIIFMVTTAVTIESAAHVDLPQGKIQPSEKPKGNIVTYTAEHLVYLNDKQVSEGELVPQLHDALQNSTDKIVIFQGDPKVILGDMVRILDLAKSAGADQIAIAVSSLPPGGGGPPMARYHFRVHRLSLTSPPPAPHRARCLHRNDDVADSPHNGRAETTTAADAPGAATLIASHP